jgi:hypothetical protein
MKGLLTRTLKGLIGIVAPIIITALITGQPLTGLVKLQGLYKTFIKSSVPAWAFAIAFMVALFGIYYTLTHLPNRRPKGKVHFVPDAHNCGWSKQTDTQMNVRIGGTFTYDGSGELIVLRAFLRGTQPTTDMMAQVENDGGTGMSMSSSELWLRSGLSQRALISLYLQPLLGTPGKPLRARLVFHDKFNRDFVIDAVEFPYIGSKV